MSVGEPVGALRDQALCSQVQTPNALQGAQAISGLSQPASWKTLWGKVRYLRSWAPSPSPRYHYSEEQSGRWLGQDTLRAFLGAAEASSHLRRRRRLAIVKGPHENDLPAAVALRHHHARCPASCAALPPPAAPRPQRALFPHNGRGAPPGPARPPGQQRPRRRSSAWPGCGESRGDGRRGSWGRVWEKSCREPSGKGGLGLEREMGR